MIVSWPVNYFIAGLDMYNKAAIVTFHKILISYSGWGNRMLEPNEVCSKLVAKVYRNSIIF